MEDLEQLVIESSCKKLVAKFHQFVNNYQHEELLELFAEEGVWEHIVFGSLKGRSAMREYLNRKLTTPPLCIIISSVYIDVINGTSAKGHCYFTHFHAPLTDQNPAPLEGPTTVGQYFDEFIKTPEGWRFLSRRPHNLFRADHFKSMPLYKKGVAIPEGRLK